MKESIIKAVCSEFDVSLDDILTGSRKGEIIKAKQIISLLMRLSDFSNRIIGETIGSSQSNVSISIQTAINRIKQSKQLAIQYERINKKLNKTYHINNVIKIKSEYPLLKGTDGSSGYDIRNISCSVTLKPLMSYTFKTGVFIQMKRGTEAVVRGRSGLWFNHSISIGQEGTIDSDYTGEIGVKLINLGENDYVVNLNDRIAQLVFLKVEDVTFVNDEFTETERGDGGYGHTGRE